MVALTLMVRSKWDQWAFQWNCVGVTTTPKGAQVELTDLSVLVWVLPDHQRLKTEFLVAWEWEEMGREWKVTRWWEALKRAGQRGAPHPPSVLWKKPAPQVEEETGGDDVLRMSLCNQGGYLWVTN